MSPEIRVALAGIGNCSSSLIQGVEYYRINRTRTVGLPHVKIGKYTVPEIRFVAGFDVDRRKVGKDLSEAIFSPPNNTRRITSLAHTNVIVMMSQPLDGISEATADEIQLSDSKPANIPKVLEATKAHVLVNLTPTGASRASEMFAQAALDAGCGFVNATPAKIASNKTWQERFRKKNIPLVGDDIMDQIGSTILHRRLLSLLAERELHIDETYQLDIGGGTESEIALDKRRYEIKRNIKTAAVAAAVPYKFPIVAGSSDFVDFMENRRTSYFWIKGQYFAGTEFSIDMRLSLEDGPACAGMLTDIIRMVKLALDSDTGGPLEEVCAYGFKSPPKRVSTAGVEMHVEKLVADAL